MHLVAVAHADVAVAVVGRVGGFILTWIKLHNNKTMPSNERQT